MSDNPLLAKTRIPGTTYRLPSRGLFYTNGELDESAGPDAEIVVNPMRTTEELILANPDKLFTGDAVAEVFEVCIPQVKKPRELLSKDVDFLLCALRLVTFGPTKQINYEHFCDDAKEHEYTVSVEEILRGVKEIDPTTIDKQFKMTLDNGQVLTLRPPRYDRVIRLYQSMSNFNEEPLTTEQLKANILDNLTDMIAKVDDVEKPEYILEWLESLKAGFVHQIQEFVERSSDWGMDQESVIVCQDCGEEVPITVPVNPIGFFT